MEKFTSFTLLPKVGHPSRSKDLIPFRDAGKKKKLRFRKTHEVQRKKTFLEIPQRKRSMETESPLTRRS